MDYSALKNMTQWRVSYIIPLIQKGELYDKEDQRENVWNRTDKIMWIDSILSGQMTNLIYLTMRLGEDGITQRFARKDGKQRTTALYEFINNRFPLNYSKMNKDCRGKYDVWDEYDGMYYKDLPREAQAKILNYELSICYYDVNSLTEEEELNLDREVFSRINMGYGLNAQELRRSRYQTSELVKFLRNSCGFDGDWNTILGIIYKNDAIRRQSDSEFLSKIIYYSMLNRHDSNKANLDDFYEDCDNHNLFNESAKGRLDKILKLISPLSVNGKIQQTRFVKNSDMYYLLCALIYLDDRNYPIFRCKPDEILEALEFITSKLPPKFIAQQKNMSDTDKRKYPEWAVDYILAVQDSPSDTPTRKFMVKLIASKIVDRLNLKQKDNKRKFSQDTKMLTFYNQGKRCAVCGEEKNLNEMEAHHIVEHQHGGTTTPDNCEMLCYPCHKEIHSISNGRQKRLELSGSL